MVLSLSLHVTIHLLGQFGLDKIMHCVCALNIGELFSSFIKEQKIQKQSKTDYFKLDDVKRQ